MYGYPKLRRDDATIVARFLAKMRARKAKTSGMRMGFIVDGHDLIDGDAGVTLRGGKRRMAEQFLDGAKISSIVEQVRGEGVTQRMRMEIRIIGEQPGVFFHHI